MLRSRWRAIAAALLTVVALAIAATADAATLPFHPSAKQGLFLDVSDIHFDPFASLPHDQPQRRAALHKLIAAPVARWQRVFRAFRNQAFPQRGKADTSYPLFMSMLSAAKGMIGGDGKRARYDYVLNTGDNLSHGFRDAFRKAGGKERDYRRFVIKTLRFVDRMLRKSFRSAPLIYAPGNNDAVCGDYKVAPKSPMLAQIARDLPVVAHNRRARRDFAVGGYYVVPHPTVPQHDIIVLNSVFWSIKYKDECGKTAGGPGAIELAWLKRTLGREKSAGRTATLAMHIPPGIDAYLSSHQACPQTGTPFWREDATSHFRALITEFKSVVSASYAGHTHMDDFRLLSDKNGSPLLATRITPAVSPVFGNNPAFAVLLYDRTDAIVGDSAVYYLTNLATAGPKVAPEWLREYSLAQTYGINRYTPAEVASLATRITHDAAAAQTYIKFYAAGAPTPIHKDNLTAYACAQTALTPASYAACRCTGNASQQLK